MTRTQKPESGSLAATLSGRNPKKESQEETASMPRGARARRRRACVGQTEQRRYLHSGGGARGRGRGRGRGRLAAPQRAYEGTGQRSGVRWSELGLGVCARARVRVSPRGGEGGGGGGGEGGRKRGESARPQSVRATAPEVRLTLTLTLTLTPEARLDKLARGYPPSGVAAVRTGCG